MPRSHHAQGDEQPEPMRARTSMELTRDMTFGWNLGNTLDACVTKKDYEKKRVPPSGEGDETLWGNPKATRELFVSLKEKGINAVRIPVTWRDHLGNAPDYEIHPYWMNRVQEIVDYAYELGFYILLNVHHDGSVDPDPNAWILRAPQEESGVTEKLLAIWRQMAARFCNYGDRLIFETMNEIAFPDLETGAAQALLGRLNQRVVDLIRGSGGNNGIRHILVAGYRTDIDLTTSAEFVLPRDPQNRLIVSVHYYTPWQFCIYGNPPDWGTDAEIAQMQTQVNKLKTAFIDKGIPVIVGEYGASGNPDSQLLFYKTFVKMTKAIDVPAFLWDNGSIVNRKTYEWRIAGLPEALQTACSAD